MALGFGRKKAAPDAQIDPENAETPQNVAPPASPEQSVDDLAAFDLDALADSVESNDDATHHSPLDADLIAPSVQSDAPEIVPSTQGSAFDFPAASHAPIVESVSESQTLDFNETFAAEQREAIASGKVAPPPLGEIEAPPETGLYPSQIAVEQPKKKLPLAPIIGAVLALGIAGAAASFLTRDNAEEETPAAPAPPRKAPPAPPQAPPNVNVASPQPALPNAAPRPLSPEMKTRLKALWQQGADAKHRGDNDAARRIWQQGLQVQPGNRGFIESIAKLPK